MVDPAGPSIVGAFNGHIPSLGRYAAVTAPITLQQALTAVGIAEGGPVEATISQRGWFTSSWVDARKPGNKELVWLLKVVTPTKNLRDYVVSATSGVVLSQGPDRNYFAHQNHRSYAPAGAVYFTTLPGVPAACQAVGPTCTEPAFSDSLKSRDLMPAIVSEAERFTTPGYLGASGVWSLPSSWGVNPRMKPYQNNHLDPAVDTFSVVVAASGFTTNFCDPFPPPCSTQSVHVYGEGDTDASLYGHEYSHGLFSMTKFLRTQTGPDGQITEAVMDIAGVSLENAFQVRRNPCAVGSVCEFPRTDFVLNAPSANLVITLNDVVLSCDVPRAWLGRSFRRAVDQLASEDIGASCAPNALCGIPTRPGSFAGEQDLALEVMFAALIRVFDATPQMQPLPSDVLAASIMLSGAGASRPFQLLSQILQASAGTTVCP